MGAGVAVVATAVMMAAGLMVVVLALARVDMAVPRAVPRAVILLVSEAPATVPAMVLTGNLGP